MDNIHYLPVYIAIFFCFRNKGSILCLLSHCLRFGCRGRTQVAFRVIILAVTFFIFYFAATTLNLQIPHGFVFRHLSGVDDEMTHDQKTKVSVAGSVKESQPSSSEFRVTHLPRDANRKSQKQTSQNQSSPTTAPAKRKKPKPDRDSAIRILVWTELSPNNPRWFGAKLEGTARCDTRIPCAYTNNHSLYNTSDVVLFHTRYINDYNDMPTYRPARQHWITFLHEAPVRSRMTVESPYHSWFNWTYTYSMSGHIVRPYGICLPNRDKVKNDPSSITDVTRKVYGKSAASAPWIGLKEKRDRYIAGNNYARGKTGLVFWAVGHCDTSSAREKYAAELKRHIQIDIIGSCVHNKCDKRNRTCMSGLFRSHKFYLAFENSLCSDYITEKTWSRLTYPIIPIVLGGADYKAFLPPHSYIDVKDYSSPKKLAAHLYKLHKNDTLYNEYFAWKRDYTCYAGIPNLSSICSICRFINENKDKTNIIPDINEFWSGKRCIPPKTYYRGIATLSYNDVFVKKKNI